MILFPLSSLTIFMNMIQPLHPFARSQLYFIQVCLYFIQLKYGLSSDKYQKQEESAAYPVRFKLPSSSASKIIGISIKLVFAVPAYAKENLLRSIQNKHSKIKIINESLNIRVEMPDLISHCQDSFCSGQIKLKQFFPVCRITDIQLVLPLQTDPDLRNAYWPGTIPSQINYAWILKTLQQVWTFRNTEFNDQHQLKRFCRVWLNQNFALNTFPKRDITESKMVNKIITIIQSHSQQSRATKKLFAWLRNYKTFLSSLKAIEQYIKQAKLLVPRKFVTGISNKQSIRFDTEGANKNYYGSSQTPVTRLSIKDELLNKIGESIRQQMDGTDKSRKRSCSPLQIKRFKSQNSIKFVEPTTFQAMKISDGETAHTGRKDRTSNTEPFFGIIKQSSSIQNGFCQKSKNQRKKRLGWVEESSYIMGQQEPDNPQKNQKIKDQLFKSQLNIVKAAQISNLSRKYSCKVSPQKKTSSPTKNGYFTKKSIHQPYFSQFEQLLNKEDVEPVNSKRIEEVDQEKFREEVSGNMMSNNGWVAKVSGLLDMPANLQQSFHQGQQQVKVNKPIKLQKLQKIGKNQMLMSILHQQIEELL